MQGSEFFDYEEMSKAILNFDKDDQDNKVRWMEVCLFGVRAEDKDAFYVKYAFDAEFRLVNLMCQNRRSSNRPDADVALMPLYTTDTTENLKSKI